VQTNHGEAESNLKMTCYIYRLYV